MFFGNVSVVGAWSDYDETRDVIYPGVNVAASNEHRGKQIISHFDTGLNMEVGKFTLRAFESLDWIFQNENGFTETGAGEYDLVVDKTHANMLRNELGLNFSGCRCYGENKAIMDVKVGWVREVRMSGNSYDSSFVGTDVPFTTVGYFPNRSLVSVGAGVNGTMVNDRLTFGVYYNGVYGHDYVDNGFGGQLTFGF